MPASLLARLLHRLLPKVDSAATVRDAGAHLAVEVASASTFASIEQSARVLDQALGIMARFGTTPQGVEDLYELQFDKAKWTVPTVRSFLARNGFDHARHDAVSLEQKAARAPEGSWSRVDGARGRVVYQDEDWWVIPGTIPTREGVMNGGYKPWSELDRSGRTFEGVPITYPHPEDIVRAEDFGRIGGQLRDVELDAAARELRADVFLARRAVAGLRVSEDALKHNAEAVQRFLAGEEVHVSVGFLFHGDSTGGDFGGAAYDHVQRNIIGNHVAILGIGANAEDGACPWHAHCGLGRAQGDRQPTPAPALEAEHEPEVAACVKRMMAHGKPREQAVAICLSEHRSSGEHHRDARAPHGEGSPVRSEGENPMASNCGKDADACSRNEQGLREARGALDTIGGHLGKAGNANTAELLQAVRDRCKEADTTKAERDQLKVERDALKGQVDTRVTALAKECATLELQVTPLAQKKGEDDEAFEARQKAALKTATERYQAYSLDALEHQRGLLQHAIDAGAEKEPGAGKRDGSRAANGTGDGPRGLVRASDAWPRKNGRKATPEAEA